MQSHHSPVTTEFFYEMLEISKNFGIDFFHLWLRKNTWISVIVFNSVQADKSQNNIKNDFFRQFFIYSADLFLYLDYV